MKGYSWWRRALAVAGGALVAVPAHALDPFTLDIAVDTTNTLALGFSNIEDAINAVDPDEFMQQLNYDPNNSEVDVFMNLRGLGVDLLFGSGSGNLSFQVHTPTGEIVISEIFVGNDGGTESIALARKDAIEQLKDFLKKDKDALKRLLTALARFSPIDPLAGNPDSLFGQRMRNDFNHGFTNKVSQIWGCGTTAFNFGNDAPIQVAAVGGVSDIFAEAQSRAAALQAQNEIGIGVLASSTTAKTQAGDYASTGLTLPLSYTAKLDSDPRKKIRFDLPLTYVDTEGAATYSLGAGLAYTHPLSDVWSLTPAVGVGATGSEDLGAAGGVGAYSLTSAYTWRFDGFALSMGNSIGRYEALGLKLGDIEAEAEIANTVYTNGFLLTGPNSLIARNLVIEYSFVDTRITGDEVYSDGYDEIGVALGYIDTEMGVIDSYTKLGLSYLVGDGVLGDINSLRLNLTARF